MGELYFDGATHEQMAELYKGVRDARKLFQLHVDLELTVQQMFGMCGIPNEEENE